jgi:hypothetical protein
MADPYTIRIYVPDGDPDGAKIIDLLNWTGICLAFPRSTWPNLKQRSEFDHSGVYVLKGSGEGAEDDLPTIYVGQGEEIRTRIESHSNKKDFWDWCFAFVSRSNALNRAHITWLEYALCREARSAAQCHLDNKTSPTPPSLSESEIADTTGFLREMLRILPLLGVNVFEDPRPVATPGSVTKSTQPKTPTMDDRDTIVVPAQDDGFNRVFLGEQCWHAIRIGGGMVPKIKHIAAYQSAPVSAVTHYAPVDRIEPYGDQGKYRVVFSEPAKPLQSPIAFGDAAPGTMQGIRYTSLERLLAAKQVTELFRPVAQLVDDE